MSYSNSSTTSTPVGRGLPGPAPGSGSKRKASLQAASAVATGSSYKGAVSPGNKRRCRCKNSMCLKMYCECFKDNVFCGESCACLNCKNNESNEARVERAVEETQQRNPAAFSVDREPEDNVTRGCKCRRSNCMKKYCECFQLGFLCGPHCSCVNCQNQVGLSRSWNTRKQGVAAPVDDGDSFKEVSDWYASERDDEHDDESELRAPLLSAALNRMAPNDAQSVSPSEPVHDTRMHIGLAQDVLAKCHELVAKAPDALVSATEDQDEDEDAAKTPITSLLAEVERSVLVGLRTQLDKEIKKQERLLLLDK